MRITLLAIAGVALAACANSHDKPPNSPTRSPYASPGVTLTSAEVPQNDQQGTTVGGEGYGGTTEYGSDDDPLGGPNHAGVYRGTRASNREKDQNGGDIRTDPISR